MNHPELSAKTKILIVPLDWGLGHATRCIPIIKALLHKGCSVFLAAERKVKSLLQEEFPDLPIIELKGYRISYSYNKFLLPFAIASQIPKMISAINHEHKWLKEVVKKYSIDAVISDNRYGLYHKEIPCIFITHQLVIKTLAGKQIDAIIQKLNYNYINQFTECWIPDLPKEPNLAGALSHPFREPSIPVKYIGPLSRFQLPATLPKEKHILLILSGPEPQRTILEKIFIQQLMKYDGAALLVRGLPGETQQLFISNNITVYNHLAANELEKAFLEASFVIGRCGYSTIMDVVTLKKKSILIPTPGQGEQEFLAKHLMENTIALCVEQKKFTLAGGLSLARQFGYKFSCENSC